MFGVTRRTEENNCINQTSQLKLILLMTALEINLVSPAGPHKLGGGLNLANRPSGPQCASLLFKCNHWKRKLKADLSWMSYNSSIQTRTHTYLKGAFISTRATKLVCFGDFIMNSWAQGHWAPLISMCWYADDDVKIHTLIWFCEIH